MALKDYYDRINHVGIPTEDMAATVRFYTDLGFTLIYETKNGDQQVWIVTAFKKGNKGKS